MIVWIDAADFQDAGQWKLDTQFAHLCGSPYLLACHTPGVPVRDAGRVGAHEELVFARRARPLHRVARCA